jgi:hypothetical protein
MQTFNKYVQCPLCKSELWLIRTGGFECFLCRFRVYQKELMDNPTSVVNKKLRDIVNGENPNYNK